MRYIGVLTLFFALIFFAFHPVLVGVVELLLLLLLLSKLSFSLSDQGVFSCISGERQRVFDVEQEVKPVEIQEPDPYQFIHRSVLDKVGEKRV